MVAAILAISSVCTGLCKIGVLYFAHADTLRVGLGAKHGRHLIQSLSRNTSQYQWYCCGLVTTK